MDKRVYAITGISNGIGRALASVLRDDGHKVIGLDMVAPADSVDQFVDLDLSQSKSLNSAAAQITEALDGVCNCAGLPPRPDLQAKILNVNFLGTRAFTKLLEPKLKTGASVVNMASRAGHRWSDGVEQVKALNGVSGKAQLAAFVQDQDIDPVRAYDLSKEALILWTMAASEAYLKRGQRINSISPGAVETGIMQDFETAFGDRMLKNVTRAGRAGRPEEVAQLAAFLLSPKSSWIKGTDISIDGGMSAFSVSDVMDLGELLI